MVEGLFDPGLYQCWQTWRTFESHMVWHRFRKAECQLRPQEGYQVNTSVATEESWEQSSPHSSRSYPTFGQFADIKWRGQSLCFCFNWAVEAHIKPTIRRNMAAGLWDNKQSHQVDRGILSLGEHRVLHSAWSTSFMHYQLGQEASNSNGSVSGWSL